MPKRTAPGIRGDLMAIQHAALRAADAGDCVRRSLKLEANALVAGPKRLPLGKHGRVFVVALGKAAPAMASAAARILGRRLAHGVVTTLGDRVAAHPRLTFVTTGHPLPNHGSLAAGEAARRMLAETDAGDLLLALISGGGSAMFDLLTEGVGLDELRRLNDLLIRSGATIQEINTVRRALSRVKSGGLARLAWPARAVGLILSDVVGDRLATVASGPTVLNRGRGEEARRVLSKLRIWAAASPGIRAAVGAGPSRSLARARRPVNVLVGSNRAMVQAAGRAAANLGLHPTVVTGTMEGEARVVGAAFARRLLRAREGTCLIMGGETTVTVRGGGVGGRNQELALAAAGELDGTRGAAILAFSSDGVDGPTDAAGAWVDGATLRRIRAAGLDPSQALSRNDSYPTLHAAGALVHTGPTGTNVADLVVGIRRQAI